MASHDAQDPTVLHQAMVLTQSRQRRNAVVDKFQRIEFRTLVVIGRLLEGFDHKNINVVAIARNVQPSLDAPCARFATTTLSA
jgi:superfamily II DNA or RNA helicase